MATMTVTDHAPFRADHVGSLLRPPELKEARDKQARGEITAAALAAVEDRLIRGAVRMQEEVGLQGSAIGTGTGRADLTTSISRSSGMRGSWRPICTECHAV